MKKLFWGLAVLALVLILTFVGLIIWSTLEMNIGCWWPTKACMEQLASPRD